MSNLDAGRPESRPTDERTALPLQPRLGVYGSIALLIIAVLAGLAEIHIFPSFSADDVASLLFGAG